MNSMLRKPVALATAMVSILCASAASAQEPAQQPAPAPQQQQPQQSQPVQSVNIQQPQPQAQPAPAATTTTTAAPYAATDRASDRTIERRPNRALLSTGGTVFLLSYVPSVVAGAVSSNDADRNLFIPVVGPWMALADHDGKADDVAKGMIITSGVAQTAGILLAVGSLIIPESTRVEERTVTAKAQAPKVSFTPVSFAAGAGVGAVGRF